MRRLAQTVVVLAIGAVGGGCSSEQWVDFSYLSSAPPSVTVDRDRIEIPAGIAVGVQAIPVEDGTRTTAITLDMVPTSRVIGIDRALEAQQWVIYGVAPGATEVELWFDDELVGAIPAVVTEQHQTPD